MGFGTARGKAVPRVPLRHGEGNKGHLTSFGGLAALSLDALSSVAYGPEAIVLVLAAAGTAALRLALPVTLAITGLLVVLVVSYCQVIAVHPMAVCGRCDVRANCLSYAVEAMPEGIWGGTTPEERLGARGASRGRRAHERAGRGPQAVLHDAFPGQAGGT